MLRRNRIPNYNFNECSNECSNDCSNDSNFDEMFNQKSTIEYLNHPRENKYINIPSQYRRFVITSFDEKIGPKDTKDIINDMILNIHNTKKP